MSAAINEQLYRNIHAHHMHEWGEDRNRRTRSQQPLWKPSDSKQHEVWEVRFCDADHISSTREQIMALNTEIDEIYDQLAVLVAKRDAAQSDLGLENQVTELFERLQAQQKQEADLIRTMLSSPPTGAIAIGLAILESADELRAKYGNITTSNPTTNRPH